jgi:LysM repeat protein
MATDRFDPDVTPDGTTDATVELTDEFWGERPEWTPQRPPSSPRTGLGTAIGRWWDRVLGGDVTVGRSHGRPAPRSVGPADTEFADTEPTADPRAATMDDVVDLDSWTIEPDVPPARRGGVDPLLARIGGLAVIVTLASPLIVGFTASDRADGAVPPDSPALVATVESSPASSPTAHDGLPDAAALDDAVVGDPVPAAPATSPSPTSGNDTNDFAATEPSTSVVAGLEASADADADAAAVTTPVATAPACAGRYEVAAGDYWIRLADAAGVALSELLTVNDASVDTVLVPGATICLPAGAATPSPPPPPTAAPAATTPAPSNTTRSTTSPSSTASSTPPATVTTTTVAPAPTTTAPARPAAVPTSQAVQIIRDAWPDELEERAIEIAWRESNHRSNVNNWCCYGLFQIHWNAHKSWLGTVGITSVSQLYDPVLNANAAYALYQRSGGFGPWGG